MTLSAAWTQIFDGIRVACPGVMENVMQLEIFNACDEFLRDSMAWYEEIEFVTVDGQRDYTLTAVTTPSRVDQFLGVFDEGNNGVDAAMYTPGIVSIDDPRVSGQIYVAICIMSCDFPATSDGVPVVPEWIVEKYYDVLLAGTLARLMIQPTKPYANSTLALVHSRRFAAGKAVAKREFMRSYTFRAQPWSFPQSWQTKSRGV